LDRTRLGLVHGRDELGGVAGRGEAGADLVVADDARDAAERLDVGPGRGLRADEQEEQADGLAIERVEFNGIANGAGGHTQIGDSWRLAVRYRDAVADT